MNDRMRITNSSGSADLEGSRVLILTGEFSGQEGICLGRGTDPKTWAVSPDESDRILNLEFKEEFALLVDLSGNDRNN